MQTVILLGPPGSGKGTQSVNFIKKLDFFHVSTGDLIRAEIKNDSDLGKEFKSYSSRGELVPDTLVLDTLKSGLQGKEDKNWLLDGFPRTENQAGLLEKLLTEAQRKVDYVFYLSCDEKILIKRLTGRRTCGECSTIYNVFFMAPKAENTCDNCGSQDLIQRKDDTEEVVGNRLRVYREETYPLIKFYENKGCLFTVDAQMDPQEVWNFLKSKFE